AGAARARPRARSGGPGQRLLRHGSGRRRGAVGGALLPPLRLGARRDARAPRRGVVERPRGARPRPRARLASLPPRLPRRARTRTRPHPVPARLLGPIPRPGALRRPPATDARRRARVVARERVRATAGRALLGRLAAAEPDVPRRSGGRGPRLGDGVP